MSPKPSNKPKSSSSEEEEVESGNEVGEKQLEESSSSEEESEEEKKLPIKPNSQVSLQKPISSTQTTEEPVTHLIAKTPISNKQPTSAKPIVKTPMPNKQPSSSSLIPFDGKTSQSNKPTSSAVVVAAKRGLDDENTNKNDSKKKTKKLVDVEDAQKSGEKSNLFKRLVFSEADDIVILNGLVDLKKKGNGISSVQVLYGNVKSLLKGDVTVNQLSNKVQKLHKKYRKNAGKTKQFGQDHYECEFYNLSEQIWGDEEKTRTTTAQKKSKSKLICDVVASPTPEKNTTISPHVEPKGEVKEVPPCSQYQYLDQSLKPHNCSTVPVPACLGEISSKNGWDMFGSSEARAFDQKWKALMIKETEAYLERVELVQEQTKWMLAAHKSSDS